ncbi:MAG: hypothetical protein ACI4UT_01895, partial [Candidatus Enteromonas sp.]
KKPAAVVTATLCFWVMAMVAVAPALLSPAILILAVPFVLAPSLYQYIVTIGGLSQDKDFDLQSGLGWRFFRTYFSPKFRGSFRLLWGLLKAILAFDLSTALLSAVFTYAGPSIWPDFNATMEEFASLLTAGAIGEASTYLQGSQTLLSFSTLLVGLAFFFGFAFFLHNMFLYGMNTYCHAMFQSPVPSSVTMIYRNVIRERRGEFSKIYYGSFWPLYLLMAVGYALGMWLGMSVSSSLYVVLPIAMAGAFTLMMFFLPFFASGTGFFFRRFQPHFVRYSYARMQESLAQFKAQQDASQEDIDAFEEMLKKYGDEMKKMDEDPNDNQDASHDDKKDE